MEDEDKEWRKQTVGHDRPNRRKHSLPRSIGRAKQGIHTQIEVSNDVAAKDYGHKIARRPERNVTRTKEAQDGREKHLQQDA